MKFQFLTLTDQDILYYFVGLFCLDECMDGWLDALRRINYSLREKTFKFNLKFVCENADGLTW